MLDFKLPPSLHHCSVHSEIDDCNSSFLSLKSTLIKHNKTHPKLTLPSITTSLPCWYHSISWKSL